MAQFTGAATGEGTARDDRRGNMSAADKRKLDGLAAIASVAAPLTLASGVLDIQAATAALEGSLSAVDKAKLDGVAAGAQVNLLETVNVSGTGGLGIVDTRGTNKTMTVTLNVAAAGAAGGMSAAHFALVAQLTQATGWTAATGLYAANWGGFATAGFPDAKYRKNLDGSVQLLGMAKKSVALALPDTILTLPAGFRPATTRIFSVATASGAHAEVRVNPAGAVFIQVGGSNVWVALEGISFDPAQ